MVKRELFEGIKKWLGDEKIIIIKGARQTGKTTLLNYIRQYLQDDNLQTVYFSVDAERFNSIFQTPANFVRFLDDQYLQNAKGRVYVFLDEFQYLDDPGLFLKNVFDQRKDRVQLIVSGSSSLEISKTGEFLTGRKIDFYLHRFSFREFLVHYSSINYDFSWQATDDWSKLESFYSTYRSDLDSGFLEYLNWGGYPEVAMTANHQKKELILKDVVSTYIQKDVSDFLRIENISGFNKLITLLSAQVGNLVNKAKLANILDIDVRTITKYLDILEGTFIFGRVSPFVTNVRKSVTKMEKIFLEDLGIAKITLRRNVYDNIEEVPGNLVENFLYNELTRMFPVDSVFFYRSLAGAEIDFVISSQSAKLLIECKFRNNVTNVPAVIQGFRERHPLFARNIVVTKNTLIRKDNGDLFIPMTLLPFVKLVSKEI